MKRVAVIGAGAAGLCAARHLLRVNIQPVLFEQKNCLGGQWAYEDVDRNDMKEVFSSMYDNLRTNLPKQVMSYPDYPFPNETQSFMHFSVVAKYLQDYAKKFNLTEYIKFNEKVLHVEPLPNEITESFDKHFVKWRIEGNSKTDVFDAVLICTGRYSVPNYPSIPGLEYFKGLTLHSQYYRRPEDFKDENVLIYGGGISSKDILAEVSKTAKKILYSHHGDRVVFQLPENVSEVYGIKRVTPSGKFVFENEESSTRIDTFIPCTGYKLNFKFLNETCGLKVTNRVIKNLYLHFINIKYPSMFVIGIPYTAVPLPIYHQQCAYISQVLSNRINLPSQSDMKAATELERQERRKKGEPYRYFHKLFFSQFDYNRMLSELSGYPPNPLIHETLYKHVWDLRAKQLVAFKDLNFLDLGDGKFLEIK